MAEPAPGEEEALPLLLAAVVALAGLAWVGVAEQPQPCRSAELGEGVLVAAEPVEPFL